MMEVCEVLRRHGVTFYVDRWKKYYRIMISYRAYKALPKLAKDTIAKINQKYRENWGKGDEMAMITEEAQRLRIIKRLKDTKPNETVCLWGWEVEVLLKMIEERKNENGIEKD